MTPDVVPMPRELGEPSCAERAYLLSLASLWGRP